MAAVAFLLIFACFGCGSPRGLNPEQLRLEHGVYTDDGYSHAPHIGGYNSDKAKIVTVKYVDDPAFYIPDLDFKGSDA